MATTGTGERDELLWKALANPWRRRILDLLRRGPATTGELADALADDLSRYAVMQHLGVLTEAGLVLVRRQGRQRFNHLHSVPLRRQYERWVSRFSDQAAHELTALERHLTHHQPDGDDDMPTDIETTTEQVQILRIENELRFRCSAERLFRALTAETLEWFPHTYGGERTQRVVIEERVGGDVYEDWGDGAGHLYGQITDWDPPRVCAMRTKLHAGSVMDTAWTIEDEGDGVVLKSSRVVVGPLDDELIAGIRFHGDLSRFEDAIRAVVEAA